MSTIAPEPRAEPLAGESIVRPTPSAQLLRAGEKPDHPSLLPRGGGEGVTREFDFGLLGVSAVLAGFGLVMILSASTPTADADYGAPLHYVFRQSLGLAAGATVGATAMLVPYARLRRLAWPLYLFAIGLLLLVVTPLGHEAKGATRWLAFGPVHVQPSEIARLALVWVLADYLANNRGRLGDVVGVGLPGLGLVLPMVVLVIFQRDFGTTVILLGLAGVMFFVAGLKWRWVVSGAALGVGLLAFLVVAEPYRMRRMTSFLDPFADRAGDGYQVVQGWVALASGGAFGSGLASGISQRGFLPEAHTDFVSAVVGEELGAAGFVFLVGLEILLVWRATAIASRAADLFGMFAAIGIGAMFGAQAIINLGVVGGLLPAKGLVLPFVSYGASAAVVHAASVGLLLKIGLQSPPPPPRGTDVPR